MSDDFNIKITGNWDFDNKKEIPEDETTKKAIDGLKDAFGDSETGNLGMCLQFEIQLSACF